MHMHTVPSVRPSGPTACPAPGTTVPTEFLPAPLPRLPVEPGGTLTHRHSLGSHRRCLMLPAWILERLKSETMILESSGWRRGGFQAMTHRWQKERQVSPSAPLGAGCPQVPRSLAQGHRASPRWARHLEVSVHDAQAVQVGDSAKDLGHQVANILLCVKTTLHGRSNSSPCHPEESSSSADPAPPPRPQLTTQTQCPHPTPPDPAILTAPWPDRGGKGSHGHLPEPRCSGG